MTPSPQAGTPAGDVVLAIQRLARASGADVQELMILHCLEGLLARIAASGHRRDFVLKGGVLLAAFAIRRPTKDIDLRATNINNDVSDVAARITAITELDLLDGVRFDPASVKATVIRDGSEYAGVRIKLVAHLGRARLTIGVDVNFGDPILPDPELIEIPRIVSLGQPPVVILGYPLTMVLAEKIVTAIDRGTANTRWRDFADIYALARLHTVAAADLRSSLETVADHRRVSLQPLMPALSEMPDFAQSKWRAWRRRTGQEAGLPERFAEVLAAVAGFADPVLHESAAGRWQPGLWRWETAKP